MGRRGRKVGRRRNKGEKKTKLMPGEPVVSFNWEESKPFFFWLVVLGIGYIIVRVVAGMVG